MGWKQLSPPKQGQGMFLLTVPVDELASSMATQLVFPASAQPANRTICRESQFMASPGCRSALLMSWATVCIVKVVSPGFASSQHIDTNPEQSVLQPSQVPPWLYGTCLSTQLWPRLVIVPLATHFKFSLVRFSPEGSIENRAVVVRRTAKVARISSLEIGIDMEDFIQIYYNIQLNKQVVSKKFYRITSIFVT